MEIGPFVDEIIVTYRKKNGCWKLRCNKSPEAIYFLSPIVTPSFTHNLHMWGPHGWSMAFFGEKGPWEVILGDPVSQDCHVNGEYQDILHQKKLQTNPKKKLLRVYPSSSGPTPSLLMIVLIPSSPPPPKKKKKEKTLEGFPRLISPGRAGRHGLRSSDCRAWKTQNFRAVGRNSAQKSRPKSVVHPQKLLVGGLNPSEKYESQLGWLFQIYGKIKNGNQTTNQIGISRAKKYGISPANHMI